MVLPERMEPQAAPDLPVASALQGQQARQDLLAPQAAREQTELLERMDPQAAPDPPAVPGPQEQQVPQGQQDRSARSFTIPPVTR